MIALWHIRDVWIVSFAPKLEHETVGAMEPLHERGSIATPQPPFHISVLAGSESTIG